MTGAWVAGGVAGAALVAWWATYALCLAVTRPRWVSAAPATNTLGGEPPAVASLVADAWQLTPDAVEATLLDLGARRFFEFRQPAADPRQTTIHFGPTAVAPTDLNRYEQAVYDRVKGLAGSAGMVPLTALTFRDSNQAARWWKNVRSLIVADARERGLSRRRLGQVERGLLAGLGLVVGILAAIAVAIAIPGQTDVAHQTQSSTLGQRLVLAGIVGVAVWIYLAGHASRDLGERDTPAGREAAARWLGVRAWLRNDQGFAELPPASVAVWDRYLGYGAALGVTRVASTVIDLGMGDRRRVWSSFGGTWHRVRISYPRFWPRYGRTAGRLLRRSIVAGVLGYLLVRYVGTGTGLRSAAQSVSRQVLSNHHFDYLRYTDPVRSAAFIVGVVLLVYAGYVLLRVIVDALAPKRLTGQVLWTELRSPAAQSSTPQMLFVAVDDASADRTEAWLAPTTLTSNCPTGATVNLTARRWSRRILTAQVVDGAPAAYHDGADESVTDQAMAERAAVLRAIAQRAAAHGAVAQAAAIEAAATQMAQGGRPVPFARQPDSAEQTDPAGSAEPG
jgi:hypothetical protein